MCIDGKKQQASAGKGSGTNMKHSCSELTGSASLNEEQVHLLDPELQRFVKVVRASRASLTYERME